MKATELQIGDWVFTQSGAEKVVEIREDVVHTDEWAYNYDAIKPIPLTPEILEKNGFRIIFESELHVSYFRDIEGFHIEVKVDKIGIYQKLSMLDGLGNGVTIVECKFFHQLQHSLRLCGIEKEIEL
jgi:hypothetical protein